MKDDEARLRQTSLRTQNSELSRAMTYFHQTCLHYNNVMTPARHVFTKRAFAQSMPPSDMFLLDRHQDATTSPRTTLKLSQIAARQSSSKHASSAEISFHKTSVSTTTFREQCLREIAEHSVKLVSNPCLNNSSLFMDEPPK